MAGAFLNVFSTSRPNEATTGLASCSQGGFYNQETFRWLMESESTRSERSGHFCQIMLVYWTDVEGRVVQMNPPVAKTVMAALSRSLRETDYIGWYSEGCIAGAVLTVLVKESMAQVSSHLQRRLAEALQPELSVAESRRLEIRAGLLHEIEGAGLREKSVAIS